MSVDVEVQKRLAMLAARDVAKADPQMRIHDFSSPNGMAIWNYGFVQGWLAAKRDAAKSDLVSAALSGQIDFSPIFGGTKRDAEQEAKS